MALLGTDDRLGYILFAASDGSLVQNAAGLTAFADDNWAGAILPIFPRDWN